jgi:protein arginine kinase activator
MQCEICKIKTATVHLTEIVDGQRTESHLCQNCAQKEGITIKSQLSLNELLSSLIAAHQQADEQSGAESQTSCPVCGMTMEIFRKNALLGCPKDYEVFGKFLEQIIEKAHDGNLAHKGKIPAGATQPVPGSGIAKEEKEEVKNENKIEELKKQLEKAVRDEDYELAAKLRDQLKALQQ